MAKKARLLIMVTWKDHTSRDSWVDEKDIDDEILEEITSVGWLVKEDDEKLVIAGTHDKTWAQLSCLQTIGKGLVISRRVLRKTEANGERKRPKKAAADSGSGPAVPA